jgi:hypothetical protein
MKALARVTATAAALAALSVLTAGVAHASSPQIDERSVGRHQTTQPRHDTVWRCNAGHGPQADCRNADPLPGRQGPSASTPAGRGGQLDLARSVVLLGLLVALAAGGYWLRRRHRPREAI